MRKCQHCSDPIPGNKNAATRFCSNRCKIREWRGLPKKKREAPTTHCKQCSVELPPRKLGVASFCSRKCSSKSYNAANRSKYRQQLREWRENNREQDRKSRLRWRYSNIEKARKQDRENYRRHRSRYIAKAQARFQAIQDNPLNEDCGTWHKYVSEASECFYCGKTSSNIHVDHFIPISAGGPNAPWNLRVSCQNCNLTKGSDMPWDFMKKRYQVTNT